jgi:hypothetical protein
MTTCASDHTEFLSDYGKDEIGLLYRQEFKFLLGSLEQTFSKDSAGADGHL